MDEDNKPTKIDEANIAANRLEEATKAQKIENDRTEQLRADAVLDGKAEAGEGVKKETPAEYATKAIAGELDGN